MCEIKEINKRYIDYATYNIWANNRLITDLTLLNDKLLYKEFVGSFPTICATVKHIWYAETIWLSRLKGDGNGAEAVTSFSGDNKALFSQWQATSKNFKEFTETVDLEKEIQFESKGDNFSIPSREIIQTVFNHGSFHRGQVVMMLRQLDVAKIQQTDYIEWVREKARGNI
ncbi:MULTISPECIES: DinB family protein [Galbibacter]|uniref:DNA polymerase n=1 Tax=Galbibacter pacificus TaxID=2996052 RepID=A0ABT6FT06_9FLAO|nr:DinB family protein [Galbibacter pacificus]MDG3582644.1 DinB family protein [Galbibacter pacificus]MDG3586237.1 DNA polymerase [Galbibacter pacificus]